MQITLIRHSGLNAWFDKLTTLSEVEGESWGFSEFAATGCPIGPVLNLIGYPA